MPVVPKFAPLPATAHGASRGRCYPPVYRPQPAGVPQASRRRSVQAKSNSPFRSETRPAPAVYRPKAANGVLRSSIQRMEGGNYFTGTKDERQQERRQNAERELGLTPAHGSSKPGKDSGINRGTLDHEQRIVEHMREQERKEYEASRPKALIHNASPMSDFAKAKAEAIRIKTDPSVREGQKDKAFKEYLVRRGMQFDEDQMFELEQALGLYD